MSYWRKKPVIIEAFRWTGDVDQSEDPTWVVRAIRNREIIYDCSSRCLLIETLEGTMSASRGDYIILGVNGEIYPCKPYIFEKTYDYVGD